MSKYILCFVFLSILINIVCGYERMYSSCNDFKLANGRMRIKPRGRLAKFQCNRGYMLAGEKYSYCIKGKFDVSPPVCVKPTCNKIKQLSNGLVLPLYNGGVVNFYCNPGFTMRGSNISYCDGSRWSHNLPACISTHTPTPTSCDFETEDLCGWSHDLNHDFDWRRMNFQTPSGHIGTGPKYDHTKGANQDGYYIYIESTSRVEYDKARIISPLYAPYPNGVCFTFWYHMYGKDMGQLRVYIRRESQNQWLNTQGMKPDWTKQGNQGDEWHRGRIVLKEGINENFQIILEGVRGKSYISDIAVDDVSLTEACPDDEEIYSSSTTESSTDEEPDVYFGSCLNRCNDNNIEIILGVSGSCECNESCHERNTCCPDYTIMCLIAALEEYSTDLTEPFSTTEIMDTPTIEIKDLPTETIVSEPLVYRSTRAVQTTEQPTPTVEPIILTTEIPMTTLKPTIINIKNNTINSPTTITPDVNNTNTEKTTSTTLLVTDAPTKQTTTNRPKLTKPTTKPTKPTTKPTKPTTIPTKPTTKTTKPTKATTKPTKPTPKTDKNNNNIDKIVTIKPETTKNTIQIQSTSTSTTVKPVKPLPTVVTTKVPEILPDIETSTNKIQPPEIETDYEPTNMVKSPTIEPKVEMVRQNDKIVKEKDQTGGNNLTLVIFCACGFVVIGVVIIAVIFTKYNTRCNRLRFRNNRNTDSMSDVRFLASDEVLDFTWRSSSDL